MAVLGPGAKGDPEHPEEEVVDHTDDREGVEDDETETEETT